MAAAFTLTDVSLHYSEKQLLSHISITISEGDKIGVVGRNGAGKSTLLRLLAGTEEPDAGDIARKRGLTLAYLPQTPHLRPEDSITQAALWSDGLEGDFLSLVPEALAGCPKNAEDIRTRLSALPGSQAEMVEDRLLPLVHLNKFVRMNRVIQVSF